MSVNPLRIRFYLDGLNFYHRLARPYGIKWIDLKELLIRLIREKIPNAEVEKILIFTALVKSPPEKRQRQQTYLSALEGHSPSIKIMYGDFGRDYRSVKNIEVPIDTGKEEGKQTRVKGHLNIEKVAIQKWEEKQTDVNLACSMVEDAYDEKEKDSFDVCCLVSADRDFLYLVKAKKRLKKRFFFIAPIADLPESPSVHQELKEHTEHKDRILTISKKLVESCQLPDEVDKVDKVTGKTEKYHIPAKWKLPKSE